jgi:predicted membrane protein
VRRDFSEVALKRGQPPADPENFAPYEMVVNLIAGVVAVVVIVAVVLGQLDYGTWTAIAGSTIWCKFFASYALSRHAHSSWAQRKT